MKKLILIFSVLFTNLQVFGLYEHQLEDISFYLPAQAGDDSIQEFIEPTKAIEYRANGVLIRCEVYLEYYLNSYNENDEINYYSFSSDLSNREYYMFHDLTRLQTDELLRLFRLTEDDNYTAYIFYNFTTLPPIFSKKNNFLESSINPALSALADLDKDGTKETVMNFKFPYKLIDDGRRLYLLSAKYFDHPSYASASEISEIEYIFENVTSNWLNAPTADDDNDGISNFDEVFIYNNREYTEFDSNNNGIDDNFVGKALISLLSGGSSFVDFLNENTAVFNAYSLNEIKDLRAGSTMIEIHNGQATLTMEVEESDDLGVWTNGSATSIQIPIDAEEGKKFFRFKMTE